MFCGTLTRSLAFLLIAAPALAAGRPVSFPSSDGTLLAGMLYETQARPAPAVVLVHMLGRSKDDWAQIADRFQALGVTALAIDLRGHGQSAGDASTIIWAFGRNSAHVLGSKFGSTGSSSTRQSVTTRFGSTEKMTRDTLTSRIYFVTAPPFS